MSRGYYTPSSVYTRRQTSDVFHNDPFKVQSYNFHYAEKPSYPVQHYQRPPPKLPEPPPFTTYYYNAKFHRNREPLTASPPTSSFVEARRRQFLQDFNRVSTPARREIGTGLRSSVQPREALQVHHPVASIPPAVVTSPPLLRTCCNREDYKMMRRGQSVTTMRPSSCSAGPARTGSRCASVSSFSVRQPEKNQSQATIRLSPRRSASSCSGCAININIRGLDSKVALDKSLQIKIETDACLHNVNTDKIKAQTNLGMGQKNRGSTESFVIDKRLSKFSLADVQATSWARKRSAAQDALLAKRLQVHSERERLEKLRQQEQKKEQERVRQREQERNRLRQAERQRDQQRLLELEAEREAQRLREVERETQRREQQRERERQQQQRMPMRAKSMLSSLSQPVVMTSHLYRPASTDRLPGMMPCPDARQPAGNSRSRSERLQNCARRLLPLITATRQHQETPRAQSPAPRSLERRSSGTSNYNASVTGSNTSMRRQLSTTRLNERKLLNLHVNGVPVSANLPIHARINNMPIRITTSQPADEHLQFSVNRVRADNALAQDVRCNRCRSRSSSRSGLEESPCNVSINVYADNPHTMRL
ncbi:hypothetical protein ACLKA7_014294 [Drosophila subpalustris]